MAARSLESWASKYIVLPDGPHRGQRFRVRREPWHEILAAISSPQLEQITIRASVQSGKTAALILAALFYMSRGRSVLFLEPVEALQRHVAKRILQFGRACLDPGIAAAYEHPRPPLARQHANGGRVEVLAASADDAGLSRTADVVIVDELRAFRGDLLQELTDRMAAFGGRGKLITASSAGLQDECKTTAEYQKSDQRQWFLVCPGCQRASVAGWAAFRYKNRAQPRYVMPCCLRELDTRALATAVNAGRWKATAHTKVPRTRGYHLDCFSGSAFETLDTVKRAWLHASEHRRLTGSMREIIAFQTGRLAVPYNPQLQSGVTPDAIMANCRQNYDAKDRARLGQPGDRGRRHPGQQARGRGLRLGGRRGRGTRGRYGAEGMGRGAIQGPAMAGQVVPVAPGGAVLSPAVRGSRPTGAMGAASGHLRDAHTARDRPAAAARHDRD